VRKYHDAVLLYSDVLVEKLPELAASEDGGKAVLTEFLQDFAEQIVTEERERDRLRGPGEN
jgi:hypothetical protein